MTYVDAAVGIAEEAVDRDGGDAVTAHEVDEPFVVGEETVGLLAMR